MGKVFRFILNVILFIPRLIISTITSFFKLILLLVIVLVGLVYYTTGSIAPILNLFKHLL